MSDNYSDLTKWRSTVFKSVVLNVLIKMKTQIYAAPAVKGLILTKAFTWVQCSPVFVNSQPKVTSFHFK